MKVLDAAKLSALRQSARNLSGNRDATAKLAWSNLLEQLPDDAEAANALGTLALAAGDPHGACHYLTIAATADPGQPALLFNLSAAARAAGDLRRALTVLDQAIVADPYFVQALFQRAILLEEIGDPRAAARQFRDFLDTVPPEIETDTKFAVALERARASVQSDGVDLAEAIATAGLSPSRRISSSIAHLTTGAQVYRSEPTFLTVPELPSEPFLEREEFSWLEQLEIATAMIRDEVLTLIELHGNDHFVPYVANAPGTALNQWRDLDHNPDWSALFLWKHGERDDANCAKLPQTVELLERLPLLQLTGRAPNAFLSCLSARTRIPPHNGVTNARVTIHLPLIIPADCGLRVGPETREWRIGRALAFDDTIEHEAWNNSAEPRVILIIDCWNPRLDPAERSYLAQALAAYDQHYGQRRADRDEL